MSASINWKKSSDTSHLYQVKKKKLSSFEYIGLYTKWSFNIKVIPHYNHYLVAPLLLKRFAVVCKSAFWKDFDSGSRNSTYTLLSVHFAYKANMQ